MPVPKWVYKKVDAESILDGAKNLVTDRSGARLHSRSLFLDPIPEWITSDDYLAWANRGLDLGGVTGWDMAVTYSKRAVCRHIDSMLVKHHLEHLGRNKNYPDKMRLLEAIGVRSFDIVHDIIIDPRNVLEHNYKLANLHKARRAVQLTELFLNHREKELFGESLSPRYLLLSIDWNAEIVFRKEGDPLAQFSPLEDIRFEDTPILLVHPLDEETQIMILHPKDHEVLFQSYNRFTTDQVLEFARIMRSESSGGHRFSYGMPSGLYDSFLSFLNLRKLS